MGASKKVKKQPGAALADRARWVLHELMEQHSNRSHVAYLAGLDSANLYRMMDGTRDLTDEVKDQVLKAMGIPVEVYLALLQDEGGLTSSDAAAYLAICHDDPALPRDPFLGELEKGIAQWLSAPSTTRLPDAQRRASLLERLENRTADEPKKAQRKAEGLLRNLLNEPAAGSGDLALGLALWAMSRRTKGSRADARDSYRLALRVLAREPDPWVEILLFPWIASVLSDFRREAMGIRLCDSAITRFATLGERLWLGRATYIRGVLLIGQERLEAAEETFSLAMQQLPAEDRVHHFAISIALARCQLDLRRSQPAFATLQLAQESCPALPVFRAHLAWLEGRASALLGNLDQARSLLVAALAVLESAGEPLDAALATVDLALILFTSGNRCELDALIDNASLRLFALRHNSQAKEIMTKLINVGLAGRLTEARLRGARRQLEAAGRPATYRRKRVSRLA